MKKMVLAICCTVLTVAGSSEAQQPRDARPRAASGTSAITGGVFSTDTNPLPLRRVRVMLSGSELELARSTITADDGSFAFHGLPAGRYTLSATKDGYATL